MILTVSGYHSQNMGLFPFNPSFRVTLMAKSSGQLDLPQSELMRCGWLEFDRVHMPFFSVSLGGIS